MATCPRCGAVRKPGKSTCWNCWALLHPEPSAPPDTKSAMQPPPPEIETSPLAPSLDTAAPTLVAQAGGESEYAPPASAPEPPTAVDEIDHTPPAMAVDETALVAQPLPDTPRTPQVFVSGPIVRAERRGITWLMVASIALFLLLLLAVLYWYFTFQAARRYNTPEVVGNIYVAALSTGDTTTQQVYATEQSTGHLFPSWFAIVRGQVIGKAEILGETARVPVLLELNAADAKAASGITAALARPFQLPLVLRWEKRGWQVDQDQLIKQLLQRILAEHPELRLPEK